MKEKIKDYLRANDGKIAGNMSELKLNDVAELMEKFIAEHVKSATPQMPLVMVPSGAVLNISKVLFIVRREIGKYIAFMENCPQGPHLDIGDLDALETYGVAQRLVMPERPVESAKVVQLVKGD